MTCCRKCAHSCAPHRLLPDQRMILEERTLERQWPALADQPDIGQRLLDDHRFSAVARADDSKDQVQVAVADLFAQQRLARRQQRVDGRAGAGVFDRGALVERVVAFVHTCLAGQRTNDE